MKQVKYLLKNIGLLAISQMGTKLLAFFLVPLYTNVLSTQEYGTYDLFNTTILLLIPFLTLDIADAALRFALDKNQDNQDVLTVTFKYLAISCVIIILGVSINAVFNFFSVLTKYSLHFILLYISHALCSALAQYARGIDKVKETAVSGVLCSAVTIGLNILLLLVVNWGLDGYFISYIVGFAVQSIYLLKSCISFKNLKYKVNKSTEKDMVKYSRPLIANQVAWWVTNASDRYVVTWLCGLGMNGVYSVGYKIPSMLNIFQTIFNQAWTISAVKDFDENDSTGFFSNTYNIYNFGMVLICSVIVVCSRLFAYLLYAKDFFEAWVFVPALTISIVFGSLSGYLGGIFAAKKESKVFAQSTVVGAVVNIVLNIVLVYFIGALGAAIATLVSYILVWIMRMVSVKRFIKLRINLIRDISSYILLALQAVLLMCFKNDSIILYAVEFFITVIIIMLFKAQLKALYSKFVGRIKKKRV